MEMIFLSNNKERQAAKCAQKNLNRGGDAFSPGEHPHLFQTWDLLLTTETTQKNKDERIIIMKKLILPKTDIIGSRQRASLAGWLNIPLTFSLIFLGFSSAIACD